MLLINVKKCISVTGLTVMLGLSCLTGCVMTDSSGQEPSEITTTEEELTGAEQTQSQQKVYPPSTEEEILNMSDEKLEEYGMLQLDWKIVDVRTPDRKGEDFGLRKEDGYEQLWRRADRSASNYDEALGICRETWEDHLKSSYHNIRLAGENDEYWLFASDYYYDDAFSFRITLMVYKKSYYDEETGTAYFELNEENIRHFFAYRSTQAEDDVQTCFGEFITEDDEGFVFHSYSIHICYGDYGINDEVILTGSEMRIYRNGKIENMGAFLRRELELPSHRLDDTLLD